MASRTWKCVPCGKAFQSSQPRTDGPKCPRCGNELTAAGSSAAGTSRLPIPQPRVAPRHESPSIPARRRSRTLPVPRPPTALRPSGPAEALAIMCGSSDDWVPDREPEPSLAEAVTFASGPFQPRVPEPAAGAGRSPVASSPWLWASIGGVVVALTFSAVVFANRPWSARPVARAAPSRTAPVVHEPRATPPAAAMAVAAVAKETVASEPRITDLLPHIDLKRDVLAGTWRITNGALMSGASRRARVGIRYPVPREYDFRVRFTQVDGNNCVAQLFTSDKPAALILGGFDRRFTGFQQIRGRWINNPANPTRLEGLKWENGRTHTSVVKVRKNSIEAWLDGKRIASHKTDGSDLSNQDWIVQGYPLGVGSELSSTIFHKIELVELGAGDGAVASPASPAAAAQ